MRRPRGLSQEHIAMTNEAFACVKIDALLAAQGWDTLNTNAVRCEATLHEGNSECARRWPIAALAVVEQTFGRD